MNRARCALKVGLIHRSLCSSASGNAPLPTLYPKKLGDIFNMDKLLTEYPLYTDDKGTVNEASIMAIQQMYVPRFSVNVAISFFFFYFLYILFIWHVVLQLVGCQLIGFVKEHSRIDGRAPRSCAPGLATEGQHMVSQH